MAKKSKSKKKTRGKASSTRGQRYLAPPSLKLVAGLAEAAALTRRRRWADAQLVLQALDRAHPNRPEVLTELVNVAYELHDLPAYQDACERLIRLEPDNQDLYQGLVGAYMANGYPWLALEALRRLLEKFPDHGLAANARENVALLEAALEEARQQANLDPAIALQVLVLDDRIRANLQAEKLQDVLKVARELLALQPGFVPALNNLSQAEFILGHTQRALELADQVLTQEPENFTALSNLARFFLLTGDKDKAEQTLARLMSVPPGNPELWLKQAEALSYFGRDEEILAVASAAEAADYFDAPGANPVLYHYRAVAAVRTGDERLARRAWKDALVVHPNFAAARANLEDLDLPPGEREGAWALPTTNWLSHAVVNEIRQLMATGSLDQADAVRRGVRRLLRRYPELLFRVPLLLERGDPSGRRIAVVLALYGDSPDLQTALRMFLAGPLGPDEFRLETAQQASQHGVMPSGFTRMWVAGEQQDLILMGIEISTEPTAELPDSVVDLAHAGYDALQSGEHEEAVRLFQEALAREPAAPSLLNNLAMAYQLQGQTDAAEAMIAQMTAQYPDYFFGIIAQANLEVLRGDLDRARARLDELLTHQQMHVSEFRALCQSFIQLLLAQGMSDAAEMWLGMWEGVEPDHPDLPRWRRRLKAKPSGRSKLGRLLRR